MPIKETCTLCKGKGSYDALVSQHDDVMETVVCRKCNGKGHAFRMTDEEEQDYHDNYW